jgi:hypothetical protein
MSVFHENMLIGSSGQGGAAAGYSISRSLRFNSADSAHLTRTFTTPTTQNTFTWAGWVKLGALSSTRHLFGVSTNHSFGFTTGDALNLTFGGTSALTTTAVFRDPSAWYHVVWRQNGTAHTIWVNNVSVGTATATSSVFNTSVAHQLGAANTANYFNGYLADIHFIDGQALDPTSFGEFSATTGVWQPIEYAGPYGANGFRLDFADNSAATATTLGKDAAGSNNWTPNNLSVTAGAGNDSLVDVLTNGAQTDTGVGGEVRGNYCTLNPLSVGANISNAQGNLYALKTTTGWTSQRSTIGVSSGKYYFEALVTGTIDAFGNAKHAMIGVANNLATLSNFIGVDANGWSYNFDGLKINSGAGSSYGATFTGGDTIGVAVDMDNGKIWFAKNGTWQASGDPVAGTNAAFTNLTGTVMPAIGLGGLAAGNVSWDMNYGARPFAYTAPSGFKALCTANLPAPTIVKPSTVMDVVTYTGTGSTLTPTSSLGFNPDLVWIKSRSAATDHALYDSVRGAQARLESNTTDAEVTSDSGVTAFNTAGFTLGTLAQVNTNTATYAAWTWDAGSSTVTNTAGTISSQVRANASAGFSVVTYTGTGANATVGHGLGVAPGMVIVKRRDATANWQVRHTSIAAASSIQLNLTNAAASAATVWNSTAPSSTVFSIGTDATVNSSAATYVAYCFAPVAGYSAFGSYTGNGSADGPMVFTNMRPRWIMIKRTNSAFNWLIYDAARNTYNLTDLYLAPNLSSAEAIGGSSDSVDLVSNGFKIRGSGAALNASGGNYIYACFAESPFQYARAR